VNLLRNLRRAMLAAAVIFGAATAARADIIIDDFNSPAIAVDYQIGPQPNGLVISTNNVQPGINRSITLNVTSPTPPLDGSMSGRVGGLVGVFTMSLDAFSSGNSTINYSFTNPVNFVPTGTSGSLQYQSFADAGQGTSVPLDFVIMTTTGNLTYNTTMNISSNFVATDVMLSNFTGSGDLTQVTGLSIMITGGQAADVALDSLGVTTPEPPPPDTVPAPPAALLALLALPALRLRNRGRKNQPVLA